MPRLVGRQSNTSSYVTFAFLLGLIIGAGVIGEYVGAINLIPSFGKDRDIHRESSITGKSIVAQNTSELMGQGRQDYA